MAISKTSVVQIVYGNTDDYYLVNGEWVNIVGHLSNEIKAKSKYEYIFNIGTGLTFLNEESKAFWIKFARGSDSLNGTSLLKELPSEHGDIFRLFNKFFKYAQQNKNNAHVVLYITHADLILPPQEVSSFSLSDKKTLVTLTEWSQNNELENNGFHVILITDVLSSIHTELLTVQTIDKNSILFPDQKTILKAVKDFSKEFDVKLSQSQTSLARTLLGLNIKGISKLFESCKKSEIDNVKILQLKKEIIEEKAAGLIEYVESNRNLNDVIGHEKVIKRLREDAKLIQSGKYEALPMGYLVCGPVGTGKSFLAECYAGEVGIPVVKIRNFRDKWVGATESNWERIVDLLKNISPVLVIVDEADAALGNREQEGDSGTSKRVFASLAQTMGDTKNRGKLIWMLLTARPELLPIDLKRQGRAEVHLPLFYPSSNEEKIAMFITMAKKNNISKEIVEAALSKIDLSQINSGADIESILVGVNRAILIDKTTDISEVLKNSVKSFRSSLDPVLVNEQIKNALAEVTDMSLIPNSIPR